MSPFKLALNASTIRGTPILRQIEVASTAGYTGIELWFADIDAYVRDGGTLEEIRAALDDRGLKVPTVIYLGGWFDAADDEWPRVREECRRRLEQATILGAPHVIAGPSPGQADLAAGAARYRELLELGRSAGALPAMEFLGFVGEYNTIESALAVIEAAADPAATIVIDPFHIFRGGGSVETLARLRPEQIAVAHFNDAPSMPPRVEQHDRDRVWPGDGHLNLNRYLRLLRKIGYAGWLSLELFREELWRQEPLEVARTGFAKMMRVVAACGD